jgi:hypothetical protein
MYQWIPRLYALLLVKLTESPFEYPKGNSSLQMLGDASLTPDGIFGNARTARSRGKFVGGRL